MLGSCDVRRWLNQSLFKVFSQDVSGLECRREEFSQHLQVSTCQEVSAALTECKMGSLPFVTSLFHPFSFAIRCRNLGT